MLFLGVDHRALRTEAWLVDPAGTLLVRGVGTTLEEALAPCRSAQRGRPTTTLAGAPARVDLPLETCPHEAALVAGALAGLPGIVVVGDEQASVLTVDRTATLRTTHPVEEVGLDFLRRRALAWVRDDSTRAGMRLKARLERRQGILGALYDLDSWPGPDPDLRGLLLAQARRLVETTRSARGRMLASPPIHGTWVGELWRPPMLDLFEKEIQRHLPEVRWRPPLLPPAAGAVLLARAAAADPRNGGMRGLVRQRAAMKDFLARLLDGLG